MPDKTPTEHTRAMMRAVVSTIERTANGELSAVLADEQ